jgi:hypothetical protein
MSCVFVCTKSLHVGPHSSLWAKKNGQRWIIIMFLEFLTNQLEQRWRFVRYDKHTIGPSAPIGQSAPRSTRLVGLLKAYLIHNSTRKHRSTPRKKNPRVLESAIVIPSKMDIWTIKPSFGATPAQKTTIPAAAGVAAGINKTLYSSLDVCIVFPK